MRKAVVALGVLVIAAILAVGALSKPGPGSLERAADPPTPVVHEHEPVPLPPDSPAQAAAVEFAAAFVDRPTTEAERAAWNAEMTRLAAPQLAEGLHWAEVERLPESTVVGSELVEIGDVAAAVRVDLADGTSWIVTVETVADGWQATDVRPVE